MIATTRGTPEIAARPASQRAGRMAYGLFVAFAGVLEAFLIVVATGPYFSNGESWQAFALGWLVFGTPAGLVLGCVSAIAVYPLYVRLSSWTRLGAMCFLNVLVVAAVLVWVAAWSAGF